MIRNPLRWMTGAAIVLAAGLVACESESVFEGEPTVAPPVTTFDAAGTAERAIHGGVLPISVIASDPYVGVDSVTIRYSGAMQGVFTRRFSGMPAQARVDTVLAVPFGTEGEVLFEAFGMNRYGSTATPGTATVLVVREDTVRPAVSIASAELPQRAELGDVVTIRVQADDNAFGSGLARVGASIRVDGQLVSESQAVDGLASATRDIAIPVNRLASGAALLNVEFYAWAVDQADNCLAVGASGAVAACTMVGNVPTITGLTGVEGSFQVTDTRSFGAVMSSASIGDLVVDTKQRRVYYSNKANNSVHSLSWEGSALQSTGSVLVGAQPWGMALDRTGDTLLVANSGGHNISYINLANLTERSRYETRNAVLYEITPSMELEHRDYSDRPQYIAQDSSGVVFYSTFPTPIAPSGSIQSIEWDRQWNSRETKMMLWTGVVGGNSWTPLNPPAPCYNAVGENVVPCVIAFADSAKIYYESPFNEGILRVFSHRPGFPSDTFSVASPSFKAIDDFLRQRNAGVFMYAGSWFDRHVDYWLSGDTTLVVASGNRGWVGFAEADRNPGQLWLWGAIGPHPRLERRLISNFANVDDFVNNTSAPVTALSMNHTGNLLVTRSRDAVHLVSNPMRLRGSYYGEEIVGGVGAALHPGALYGGGDANINWAAIGGSGPEIILVDTYNFRLKGRIPLVEPVGGPLRVVARQTNDPDDILAHIFGVTQSGTVFWVPVRATYFTN